jgi:plasmid stabilization system protein ParE
MRLPVKLRPEVPADIRSISLYLDPSGGDLATRFANSVFAAFDDLSLMPGLGSPKPGGRLRGQRLRTWFVPGFKNYLVLYQRSDDHILIIAVVHGARNLRPLRRHRS